MQRHPLEYPRKRGFVICETKIKIFKITVDNGLSPCYYVIKVLKQQQALLIQKHFSQFFYTISMWEPGSPYYLPGLPKSTKVTVELKSIFIYD